MAQGGLSLAQGPPAPHLLLDLKVTGWGQGGTEPRTRGSRTVSPGTQWPAQTAKKGHSCTGTLENSQQPQDRPQAPGACGAADARGRAVVPMHTRKVCRAAGRTREKQRQRIKLLFTPEAGRELGFELARNTGHLETRLSQTQQR